MTPTTSQKPRILIIAHDIVTLDRPIEYLTKRGWQIICVNDLRQGMELVPTNKPTHILVSVNLLPPASMNWSSLRDELKAKHQATLVVFGEKADLATSRKINSFEIEFKIFPPITGTMLEIKLKHIISPEKETPKSTSTYVTSGVKATEKELAKFTEKVPTTIPPAAPTKPTTSTMNVSALLANREFKKSSDARLAMTEIRARQKPTEIEMAAEPSFRKHIEPQTGSRPVQPLDEVEEIAVMTIESDGLIGYLVMARGKQNLPEIKKILKSCGDTFAELLKSKGITVKNVHHLEILVNRMSFDKWTKSCAQFCFTAEHLGAETAIAFIPHPKTYPNLSMTSEHIGKMIVAMSDIVQDKPVDCDLKIYLPKNKRFFLYLKKGSPFTQDRMERVGESDSALYIEGWDEIAFRTYCARNIINQMIGETGAGVASAEI